MDKQLFTLIRSYIGAVARATAVLEAADIDLPTSCDEWAATPILRVDAWWRFSLPGARIRL
jgi:hypothetical protein